MTSENSDSHNLINNYDSLLNSTNALNMVDNNDCEIHKTFKRFSNHFTLQIANIEDIKNSDILCKNYFMNESITIEEMKKNILNVEEINFEITKYIIFTIDDNTMNLSEDDKIYLANKYVPFIEFVINKFPNINELYLSSDDDLKSNGSFIFHIYKNLKSNKIEKISLLKIQEIMEYSMKYNFLNQNVFSGFERLKKINLYIHSCDSLKTLSNIDDFIYNFLSFLSKINIMIIDIQFDEEEFIIDVVLKILNFSKILNLNIHMNHPIDWIEHLKTNNNKFKEELIPLMINTVGMAIFVNEINDLKSMKVILNTLDKLEYVKICIDNSIPKVIYDNCKSLEESKIYINELFNYKCNLKNLIHVKISFGRYHYLEENTYGENLKYLYDYMMERIISILPSTISEVLYLMSADNLPIQIFNKISLQFSSLTTITFILSHYIPENALFQLPSLRNVIFNGERKVNIPSWIETVMFLYFDIDFYYPDDTLSINKKNEHYFDLMNRKFNVTLRCLDEDEIYYIIFMNDYRNRTKISHLIDIGY
ncbi:Hypothetical protein SRAE_X000104700 [Strongyloides ratti]|uniref:Uncharacterized protein n=1 Tax=Strongyloides ratti TaxID=34506 RepID=A0A090MMQ4_STRRB|nr:Hypothetical protein SRAE_X000104700 [Strongyloides ratti]CEF59296.1 Hypothetical protein SRAE_X000104700 [Strongyloides ratti]